MTVFQALVLGIVQGLGEFLPVSSSAHLIIVPWLFGWKEHGLTFDVALHMGTLLAVIAFFWQDWIMLIKNGFKKPGTREGRLFWYLVIATIPGAIIGKLFESKAETVFRSSYLMIAATLIIMGIILYVVDRYAVKRKKLEQVNLVNSVLIGIAQGFAVIPGFSRSGVTMTAGIAQGMTREAAARFSFLLSTPLILGAGVLKLHKISAADMGLPFWVGIITSAIVGFIAIKFLLRFLQRGSFAVFAWYRFLLGLIIVVVLLVRG